METRPNSGSRQHRGTAAAKALLWTLGAAVLLGVVGFVAFLYVTADCPRTFISAGNADPLLPQSVAFAEALAGRKAYVDTLFFPNDHSPALPHEYQFNLDTDAGKLALERSVKFLAAR